MYIIYIYIYRTFNTCIYLYTLKLGTYICFKFNNTFLLKGDRFCSSIDFILLCKCIYI